MSLGCGLGGSIGCPPGCHRGASAAPRNACAAASVRPRCPWRKGLVGHLGLAGGALPAACPSELPAPSGSSSHSGIPVSGGHECPSASGPESAGQKPASETGPVLCLGDLDGCPPGAQVPSLSGSLSGAGWSLSLAGRSLPWTGRSLPWSWAGPSPELGGAFPWLGGALPRVGRNLPLAGRSLSWS